MRTGEFFLRSQEIRAGGLKLFGGGLRLLAQKIQRLFFVGLRLRGILCGFAQPTLLRIGVLEGDRGTRLPFVRKAILRLLHLQLRISERLPRIGFRLPGGGVTLFKNLPACFGSAQGRFGIGFGGNGGLFSRLKFVAGLVGGVADKRNLIGQLGYGFAVRLQLRRGRVDFLLNIVRRRQAFGIGMSGRAA